MKVRHRFFRTHLNIFLDRYRKTLSSGNSPKTSKKNVFVTLSRFHILVISGCFHKFLKLSSKYSSWNLNFESLLSKARQSNLINSDFALKTILDEMNTFRGCCGMLQSFDWISIPLVYTQVVTVAVYGFFVSCLFGRQYLIPQNDSQNMTLSVPVPNYEYEVGFIS